MHPFRSSYGTDWSCRPSIRALGQAYEAAIRSIENAAKGSVVLDGTHLVLYFDEVTYAV